MQIVSAETAVAVSNEHHFPNDYRFMTLSFSEV
jgi:hypothetical protein